MKTYDWTRLFGLTEDDMVSISGGGGKTGLLFLLQKELTEQGRKNLVSTTAQMFFPEDQENLVISRDISVESFSRFFLDSPMATLYLAGSAGGGKVRGVSEEVLGEIFDCIRGKAALLSECDGSARKPYRIRRETDPGIIPGSTLAVHVIGAEIGGAIINEDLIHRLPDELCEEIADASVIRRILKNNLPPNPEAVPVYLVINKADSYPEGAGIIAEAARGLFDRIFIASIREGWIEEIEPVSDLPVILSAGLSRRMSELGPKVNLPYRGWTILKESDWRIRGITGKDALIVANEKTDLPEDADVLINEDPQRGQGTSLALAAKEALTRDEAGILIFLADTPGISRSSVHAVMRAAREHPDAIILPVSPDGTPAHPVRFPKTYLGELSMLEADEGGRVIIRRHPEAVIRVPVTVYCEDIDTPEDYRRLTGQEKDDE